MRLIILFLLIYIQSSLAQNFTGTIKGYVKDKYGEFLAGVSISLKNKKKGSFTDEKGQYEINLVSPGKYTLEIISVGYKKQVKKIKLLPGQNMQLNIVLETEVFEGEEVLVEAKSTSEKLREKGFAVTVIESKAQKNLTADINQVLKITPGINIRESGGLGSGFKLSLNGLTGNQIRYFIDGVPMENFGSSLSLNNYPINLIDKLEVYKGVVPVSLGADALGGAVNIVTGFRQKSFFDMSYSFASFNTHRASVNGQYADHAKGYFLKLSSFFNHSDNNYNMRDVPVYDLELGNYKGTVSTKRNHDQYTSKMFHAELGLFDKTYADKWSISLTAASNKKNYQHPDNNILHVFGDFHTRNNTMLISSTYQKEIKNLSINAYILYGRTKESIVDTGSTRYNWEGKSLKRKNDDPRGEIRERRSLMEMNDDIIRSNISLIYKLDKSNIVTTNFSQNYLKRKGEDKVDVFNVSFESPNNTNKNLLGLAYTYKTDKTESSSVEATAFTKQYWYSGKISSEDYNKNVIITEPNFKNTGYGAALSWKILKEFSLKSSFEKAYRIPESFEILGDGIYVNPNPALGPEKSYNFNIGSRYNTEISEYRLRTELNYFLRSSKDFIKFSPLGPFGKYENLNNIRTEGIEGSFDINYNELISLNLNATYQNLTDRTEFDEGLRNTNYKSRVPNIPYFFLNSRFAYSPSDSRSENKFNVYWNIRYIHEFFLTWEKLGNTVDKNVIPAQLTHNLQIEYSISDGSYNFSLAVNNITDETVYDNFNIQKPGRSFSLKLRYFLRY